jgi:hypothetical protein
VELEMACSPTQCYAVIIPALDAFSGFVHVRACALSFGALLHRLLPESEGACMYAACGWGEEKMRKIVKSRVPTQ